MKTAFFASDPIALRAIEYLRASKDFPLACVVSNPDKPKGRGKKLQPNDVSAWAIENGVELLRPEKGPTDETVARLRELGVELLIVMAYGCMLRKNILEYSKYPCLNIHASLLPELRGASPIETAIALGLKETGVSLMKIIQRMDAGPVCAVKKVSIGERETSHSLREKISCMSPELLDENLNSVKNFAAEFVGQDDSKATYARKLSKDDMRLNFSLDAKVLDARIRAFGFGIFEYGGELIKVRDAFAIDAPETAAGKVLRSDGKGLVVACGKGALEVKSLQRPCAKMLCAEEFFKGFSIARGAAIESFKNESLLRER